MPAAARHGGSCQVMPAFSAASLMTWHGVGFAARGPEVHQLQRFSARAVAAARSESRERQADREHCSTHANGHWSYFLPCRFHPSIRTYAAPLHGRPMLELSRSSRDDARDVVMPSRPVVFARLIVPPFENDLR
jgi:hypothetical protein